VLFRVHQALDRIGVDCRVKADQGGTNTVLICLDDFPRQEARKTVSDASGDNSRVSFAFGHNSFVRHFGSL
jgi:hypothetical protein